ncbi:coiled-coil domain-containing protein 130 homolog [Photinus pyralis]|uniref:coiled-coil domain-containing protein 130 homolog n=1 Tax=Photinus pyralis TaxID=7054 RepID=UPI0012670EAB|nr:coiled-coil domain-containing protein 130 homolog [Photinus pyralis]
MFMNLEYIVLSGARRQENRWDPTQNEQVVPETKETQKRLFDDSMFKLEHGTDDQNYAENAKTALVNLYNRNESTWADDYSANCMLRQAFRKNKNDFKTSIAKDNALLKKSSLNIKLVPEAEEDKQLAAVLSLKLKPKLDAEKTTELIRKNIISESSLPCTSFTPAKERKAIKVLNNNDLKKLVLINKPTQAKKIKLTPSLVGDYGNSTSESE